jgi:hypothetical protein
MKKIILTLLLTIPTLIFSQNYKELDSVSAGNIYFSTNKKIYITEYLTEPESRFVFFVKDSTDYNYVYFQSKNEIVGLISMVIRSIEKQKDVIYNGSKEFTIISITKNISKIKVGDFIFSMDRRTAEDIIKQFQQI